MGHSWPQLVVTCCRVLVSSDSRQLVATCPCVTVHEANEGMKECRNMHDLEVTRRLDALKLCTVCFVASLFGLML